MQHYVCDSWDKRIRIWGAMTQPGATFTPACGRLARVIYIHYLSKVASCLFSMILPHRTAFLCQC